jgi:hypothetical protein
MEANRERWGSNDFGLCRGRGYRVGAIDSVWRTECIKFSAEIIWDCHFDRGFCAGRSGYQGKDLGYAEDYSWPEGFRAEGGLSGGRGQSPSWLVRCDFDERESSSLPAEGEVGRSDSALPDFPLVVEADSVDLAIRLLRHPLDRVLLDNMSVEQVALVIQERSEMGSQVDLEASGGVTLERVRELALTGVEWISVGSLTHSARAIDLSLDIQKAP